MSSKTVFISIFLVFFSYETVKALAWVDSVDLYARTVFLPAKKYHWTWQSAALLRAMMAQYEWAEESDKEIYLDYIVTAMNNSFGRVNGKTPNAVASGVGMAFLARVTGEEKYRIAAKKVYEDYLKIPRTENGGVTHKRRFRELWDDTIFMIGVFLQEMYKLTGDEKYLDELVLQIEAHREKLQDEKWGLWYHGWDGDEKKRCNLCGQSGWSKNELKRSEEIWGRGNGWVIVTLTQTLEMLPESHPQRTKLSSYLSEMLTHLPSLQDTVSGHWFQLPVHPYDEGNYIESSCTAMFAYGIDGALKMGILSG